MRPDAEPRPGRGDRAAGCERGRGPRSDPVADACDLPARGRRPLPVGGCRASRADPRGRRPAGRRRDRRPPGPGDQRRARVPGPVGGGARAAAELHRDLGGPGPPHPGGHRPRLRGDRRGGGRGAPPDGGGHLRGRRRSPVGIPRWSEPSGATRGRSPRSPTRTVPAPAGTSTPRWTPMARAGPRSPTWPRPCSTSSSPSRVVTRIRPRAPGRPPPCARRAATSRSPTRCASAGAGRVVEARAAAGSGEVALRRGPWYRHLMHRLCAEAAGADGWGDPTMLARRGGALLRTRGATSGWRRPAADCSAGAAPRWRAPPGGPPAAGAAARCRGDRPGGRGAGPGRRGALQPGDRRAALPLGAHRRAPRRVAAPEAGGPVPGSDGGPGGGGRPTGRLIGPPHRSRPRALRRVTGAAEIGGWHGCAGIPPRPESGAPPRAPIPMEDTPMLVRKNFSEADEVRSVPHGRLEVVKLPGQTLARAVIEPGWRWSQSIKPMAGTPSCEIVHTGYVISGRMHVRMDDGSETEYRPRGRPLRQRRPRRVGGRRRAAHRPRHRRRGRSGGGRRGDGGRRGTGDRLGGLAGVADRGRVPVRPRPPHRLGHRVGPAEIQRARPRYAPTTASVRASIPASLAGQRLAQRIAGGELGGRRVADLGRPPRSPRPAP